MNNPAVFTMRDWRREFEAFFEWCNPRLEQVLDAGAAREVWLQGEAYRYFRFERATRLFMRTNGFLRSDLAFYGADNCDDAGRCKHDPVAVVEIKLFGLRGYYKKNLDGFSDMRLFQSRRAADGRCCFVEDDAEGCGPESSILKDYRKLLSCDVPTRLLMLVLDRRYASDADEFGEAIEGVDFGGPAGAAFDSGSTRVKVWQVR